MIKALQRKFIFSAMLAITVLLALLLGAINGGNMYMSARQSRQLLDTLLSEESMPQPRPKGSEPKGLWQMPVDENSRMSAVYFTVRTDQAGSILRIDTSRIATVSADQAEELYRSAADSGLTEGKLQSFRYRWADSPRDGGRVWVFLETSIPLRSALRVLLFSLAAGAVCWLAMLLLVVLLSRRAIRPIAENIARQKQFVTDAGHEIKTPLAIILANTEAMELYQGESKWSRNIREQTARLSGLMQDLLALAKADEGADVLRYQRVPVSGLVSELLEMFAEPAALRGLTVERQLDEGVEMRADPEQLRRLFSILLDNAVKYASPCTAVQVLLRSQAKGFSFQVQNRCEALPACPPETLFDRFYRADAARSRDSGGYGIGLSAAKAIVRLYGGTIQAAYQQPDQIIFTVSFS